MIDRTKLTRRKLLALAVMLLGGLWFIPIESASAGDPSDTFVIGSGIVVGLPGTGDSIVDQRAVDRSIVGLFRHMGADVWGDQIAPHRVAKVIVVVELPRDREHGAPLVVTVTPAGDATSLVGGTLLATPLRYSDGQIYAVGQGQITAESHPAELLVRRHVGELAAEFAGR
jgi:flagellar basal body P-ring protein FlgI